MAGIEPDDSVGEPPLLPYSTNRPIADTNGVDFKTVKPCFATVKSHISHVAADTGSWEQAAAFRLEASPAVESYARNERLELAIPYEFVGLPQNYYPDFIVRLTDGSKVILEVKFEDDGARNRSR
jgi:type III restriction enzyme